MGEKENLPLLKICKKDYSVLNFSKTDLWNPPGITRVGP
jgi:hypothetical protein